jgi:hypothetical protein
MSARKGKNGFVRERIVSSPGLRRNIQARNRNDFNEVKIGRFQVRKSFVLPPDVRKPLEKQGPATTHAVSGCSCKRDYRRRADGRAGV